MFRRQHDARAVGREGTSDRQADARAASGDERGFTLQHRGGSYSARRPEGTVMNALLLLLALMTGAPGLHVQHAPDSRDIVSAFLDRPSAPPTSYRARRHLEAENLRFNKQGWLDVVTELGPNGFTYEVVGAGGSEYVRKRVLLAALDGERDLVKTSGAGALDTANYRFSADGLDGDLARIRLQPTRKDRLLVDGWLF